MAETVVSVTADSYLLNIPDKIVNFGSLGLLALFVSCQVGRSLVVFEIFDTT